MIDIQSLSSCYTVRQLTASDADVILDLCKGNPLFYEYTEARPTREQILDDMKATPPGINPSDKYFLGFFREDNLVAVMDLIDGYPNDRICYIGFFMMNRKYQGQQTGTSIISEVSSYLEITGKTAIRLAIDNGNPQSTHFWKKNGFAITSEADVNGWTKLVAERNLNEIILVEPTEDYVGEIWAFRQEIMDYDADNENQFAGCSSLGKCTSPKEWINICRLRKSEETCADSGATVPSHMYLAVRKSDNRIVGGIDLRHHINHPILGTWGGHCGYSVRPSERGKGYAKKMLRLNIQNAAKLGIDRLLVTCDEGNIASEKTILANGGKFEKTIDVDGEKMKRYWISVGVSNLN